LNLYAYCYNNPLNLIDPDGLEPFFSWNGTAGDATLGTLNFLAGVGDTVSFGATDALTNGGSFLGMDFGGGLNDAIHGSGTGESNRCQQECSGSYTTGQVVGYGVGGVAGGGKAIAKWGANSARFGKGSSLFGTGAFRSGNGLLNGGLGKSIARLGWGKDPAGKLGFRLAIGPNTGNGGSLLNRAYGYLRHIHF
jgi:hypothetical protein